MEGNKRVIRTKKFHCADFEAFGKKVLKVPWLAAYAEASNFLKFWNENVFFHFMEVSLSLANNA
jgi:hypothetical protein